MSTKISSNKISATCKNKDEETLTPSEQLIEALLSNSVTDQMAENYIVTKSNISRGCYHQDIPIN